MDGSGKAFSSSSFPGGNLSLPFDNLVGEIVLVSVNLGSDFSDVSLVIEGTGLFFCKLVRFDYYYKLNNNVSITTTKLECLPAVQVLRQL